jgi:hypothetical protein
MSAFEPTHQMRMGKGYWLVQAHPIGKDVHDLKWRYFVYLHPDIVAQHRIRFMRYVSETQLVPLRATQ